MAGYGTASTCTSKSRRSAHDRILKVARTIADLDGRDEVGLDDVSEAIGYRVLDRPA